MAIKVPTLTKELANEMALVSLTQLKTSRDFKRPRLQTIKASEDLYNGIAEKQIRNPFNDCFPFMSGFIDHLESKLDDPPMISFGHQNLADYKRATKTTSFYRQESGSYLPGGQWARKDRWVKKLAMFSGVGIYKYFAESDPSYRSNLGVVDYYDFHCEPGGGANLEDHLFCGEEGIFKTREYIEEMAAEGYYDKENVKELLTNTSQNVMKQNESDSEDRISRYKSLGLDPVTNNYVGQEMYKFVEWYLTYKGVRWYMLIDEFTGIWIRAKALREMFSPIFPMEEALYPYVTWQTHEDAKVFWSKAPADDARVVAKNINRLINQELYNRERRNYGQRGYDPQMFKDVEALAETRPDGLIPVDTKNGTRQIASGIYEFKVGDLGGTINLVEFLDSYAGQKTGATPGSMGSAEPDKKVGVFYGEIKQIEDRLGLYNKSYRDAWAQIGLRFRVGLKDHIKDAKVAVKVIGSKGMEWADFTNDDANPLMDYDMTIEGGNDTEILNQEKNKMKVEALMKVQTVNRVWKDREILKAAGYDEEDLKEAFSIVDPGLKDLLSEAEQAIEDILNGGAPELNRGANAAFIQYITDYATNLTMEDKDEENELAVRILSYAQAHAIVAAQNEARNAMKMIDEAKIAAGMINAPMPQNGANPMPSSGNGMPSQADFVQNPSGAAISAGNQISAGAMP